MNAKTLYHQVLNFTLVAQRHSAFIILILIFGRDHIVKFNGEIYADLTDKGANTIRICRLNRRLRKFGINEQIISNLDKFHLMNKIIKENKI